MYRRMISGMLAVAMTFQMCAGTVHAAGNAKQVTSQPAGTELFVRQEQAEEMAAVESAADFMPETSTETNKETSAEENTEGNILPMKRITWRAFTMIKKKGISRSTVSLKTV